MLLPNQHRDCHQWKRSCLGPPSKYLCKMCSNMFGDGEFLNLLTSISVCLFSDSSPNSLTDPEWNNVKQQHVLPANTLQIRSAAPWDFRSSCSSRRQPEKVCWYRLEQGLETRWGSWLIRLHAHTPQLLPCQVHLAHAVAKIAGRACMLQTFPFLFQTPFCLACFFSRCPTLKSRQHDASPVKAFSWFIDWWIDCLLFAIRLEKDQQVSRFTSRSKLVLNSWDPANLAKIPKEKPPGPSFWAWFEKLIGFLSLMQQILCYR